MSPALRLVLASASPRRRELLAGLGIECEIRPAAIDERRRPAEATQTYVERLAGEKAAAVARPGELVVAADTIVEIDGVVLGKPLDDRDARRMLKLLSGRTHLVRTGVALLRGAPPAHAALRIASDCTEVRFAALSDLDIDRYVASGEPRDKAGAYAVQGLAALFIPEIRGSWSNVVGLPLATLQRLASELGVDLLGRRDGAAAGPTGALSRRP